MAHRPEFLEFRVGDEADGTATVLGALSWPGIVGAPTVLAVHGITANAWSWDPVAHYLAGGAHLVAVDLRGRGRSYRTGGPYGMRRHADDVAEIVDHLGGPLSLAGHSMGAYVVLMAAERHPALVRDLLLVDGGTPLPRPDGDIDAALEHGLGPAIERLGIVWPDRVSYQSMWSQHPAFVDGIGPHLERNLLADLVEVDGGFRTAVDEEAVRYDGRELLADDEVRTLLDRREQPTTIVRAEYGMFGTPPPMIAAEHCERYAQHRWIEGHGLNHYTVMTSAAGATLVADALRSVITRP